jgi:hypothetical protein
MSTTAELITDELIMAAEDLLKFGTHDGNCTNEHQMKILPKVPPCSKHLSAMKSREARFRRAVDQFKLLRDVFGNTME